MVFTPFGLHARRASHSGCRGKLKFVYPSNKILLQFSWTQFPVNHNKWPFKRLTMTRDTIQYETKLFPRLSLLTPLLILIHFPLHILSVVFSWHYRHSLTCALVHLKVTSASLRLYLNWEALGGVLCSREPWLHTHAEQAFWGQCEIFCEPVPVQHDTWSLLPWAASQAVVLPQWRFPKWHPLDLTRKIITRCRWGFFIETDLEKFNNRLSAVNGCQHESPISW